MCLTNLIDGPGHPVLGAAVDDHPAPFSRQGFGNGKADPGGGTRHQGQFVLDLEVHKHSNRVVSEVFAKLPL